jgi:hypothetical protein
VDDILVATVGATASDAKVLVITEKLLTFSFAKTGTSVAKIMMLEAAKHKFISSFVIMLQEANYRQIKMVRNKV